MFSAKIKRIALRIFTSFFSKSNDIPKEYQLFSGKNIPANVKKSIVSAYIKIFSEEPWYESWKSEDVLEKIENDLEDSYDSFLSVCINEEGEVKGFIWGDLINPEEVAFRAAKALNICKEDIKIKTPKEKVLYFDEFAILKGFRGGPDLPRFMLRNSLEHAYKKGVSSAFCWSTPDSKIVKLALIMGYERAGNIKAGDKEIEFFYYPGFEPMMKMTQLSKGKNTEKIMKFFSKRN
jgi:hypothetical protein